MANSASYARVKLFTVAVMVLILLSTGHMQQAKADSICDPVQLSWCLQSIVTNSPPTTDCCVKLKDQEACLCRELSDPTFGGYLLLAGAKTVCTACNVTFPYC